MVVEISAKLSRSSIRTESVVNLIKITTVVQRIQQVKLQRLLFPVNVKLHIEQLLIMNKTLHNFLPTVSSF